MTLPPEKIGDKGQRFEIRYTKTDEALELPPGKNPPEHVLGWCDTMETAERMKKAWYEHPSTRFVWIIDRGVKR